MALVTISGYPCSGKTRRAQELLRLLEERQGLRVCLVNDESVGLSKSAYDDTKTEKPARAAFFAAVQRAIASDCIVIADALNYIKGYRYQLYCAAREAKIRTCTIHHVGAPDDCRRWNSERPPDQAYSPAILDNLISRFEEPSYSTRWDTPLFVVANDAELPIDAISAALQDGKAHSMPVATVQAKSNSADYMRQLDTVTSSIVSARLAAPSLGGKAVTPAQLHRIKRQFLTIHRTAGVGTIELDEAGMRRAFGDYLDGQLS